MMNSKHNRNHSGCLELIPKFDPFLASHIDKCLNKGRGKVSLLSSKIFDEFIDFMNKNVLKITCKVIKLSKYFSIISDSLSDISKADQLTIAIRCPV